MPGWVGWFGFFFGAGCVGMGGRVRGFCGGWVSFLYLRGWLGNWLMGWVTGFLVAGWVYGWMCVSDCLFIFFCCLVEWGGFMMAGWVCLFCFFLCWLSGDGWLAG